MRPSMIAFFTAFSLSGQFSEAVQSLSASIALLPEVISRPAAAYLETNSFNVPRPVKVIMWSKFLMRNPDWMRSHVPNCHLQRAFERTIGAGNVTIDPDYDISDADVVLFNLAPLEQLYVLPRKKMPGQLWIAGCWEPAEFDGVDIGGDCSLLNDEKTMQWMDGVASYDNSSTFPAFFTPPTEGQMRRSPPDSAWQPGPLAEYSSSDCRVASRNDWVGAVNRSLAARNAEGVLSFGKCLPTAKEQTCSGPEAISEPTDDVEEWTFIKYANRCMARPFTLVAENSMAPWYVTEKVWNALATGSVPVYWGPPEVKHLVPPDSIIFAGDYKSTDDLVDAMLRFDLDAHRKAREFKEQPVQSWGMWSRARTFSRATLMARLCEAVAARDVLQEVGPPPVLPAPNAAQQSAQLTGAGPASTVNTQDMWTRAVLHPRANATSVNTAGQAADSAQVGNGTSVASTVAEEEEGSAQDRASQSSGADPILGNNDLSKVSAGGASAEAVWQQVLVGAHGKANATVSTIHAEDVESAGRILENISRVVARVAAKEAAGSSTNGTKHADRTLRHTNSSAARPDHTHTGHHVSKLAADKTAEELERNGTEDASITDKIAGFLKDTASQDKKSRMLLKRLAEIKEHESHKIVQVSKESQ